MGCWLRWEKPRGSKHKGLVSDLLSRPQAPGLKASSDPTAVTTTGRAELNSSQMSKGEIQAFLPPKPQSLRPGRPKIGCKMLPWPILAPSSELHVPAPLRHSQHYFQSYPVSTLLITTSFRTWLLLHVELEDTFLLLASHRLLCSLLHHYLGGGLCPVPISAVCHGDIAGWESRGKPTPHSSSLC